jgi:hypothetical protein
MPIVAKLDELGKPAWIALMIFGFCVFWPLGFAVLAFALWSGRMGCWRHGANNYGVNNRWRQNAGMRGGPGTWWQPPPRSSGNRAFDEYRFETLKRLEDEQREFHEFLDRLRMAKDKSEFDQFMAERRNRPDPNPDSSPQH